VLRGFAVPETCSIVKMTCAAKPFDKGRAMGGFRGSWAGIASLVLGLVSLALLFLNAEALFGACPVILAAGVVLTTIGFARDDRLLFVILGTTLTVGLAAWYVVCLATLASGS
jgi:hypothetical protein